MVPIIPMQINQHNSLSLTKNGYCCLGGEIDRVISLHITEYNEQ